MYKALKQKEWMVIKYFTIESKQDSTEGEFLCDEISITNSLLAGQEQ